MQMSSKSIRKRRKRKPATQLAFAFLDYERSKLLIGFISPRQPPEVCGRRQRALFSLPFLGERLIEFASVIDRGKPLIPAVAARLGVSVETVRYLRNFTASELNRLYYPLEEVAAAAQAVRLPAPEPALLLEAVRRLRILQQISQASGIPQAELASRAAVLERLPESFTLSGLAAPLRTVYEQVFLPELFILARLEGKRPTAELVQRMIKGPPANTWTSVGRAFFGLKGPAAILETIASWNAGGGQPLSTPGGKRAMDLLRQIPPWGALLPQPFSAGDLRVRAIVNVPDLIEEGLALRHCIARYAMSCSYYGTHVLGVATAAGYRLSTALLRLSPEGKASVIDHRGFGNCAPDPRAAKALEQALAHIETDRAAERLRVLEVERNRRLQAAGGEDAATLGLYPLHAPFLREYTFRAYCAPYLNKEDRELSRDAWLQKTGLQRVARELFATLSGGFETADRAIPPPPGLRNAVAR
jgi:hypothetical protein